MVDMKLVDKINKITAVLEMPDGSSFHCSDCGSSLFVKTNTAGVYACAKCSTLYQVTISEEANGNG